METVSAIVTGILNALIAPFGAARHTLGLIWLSFLAGIVLALVYKLTSNREKIRRSKDLFKSFILEMRIYQDDPGIAFHAFLGALRANLGYTSHILVPLLVLIVPAAIVFMQLDERYGRSEIHAGSTTVLTAFLDDGVDPFQVRSLVSCSPGVSMDAGPVRIREGREIAWRLAVDSPGTHAVTISMDGHSYTLPLVAERAHRMIGSTRSSSSLLEPFLHPALPPLPDDSPIKTVKLRYPNASYPLFVWRVHWIVMFLIVSLAGAAAVKLLVGFEI